MTSVHPRSTRRPRMRLTVLVMLAALVCATTAVPARAQWVVSDPGNLAQTVLIAQRTLSELLTLIEEAEAITRMARSLPGLDAYRIPTIATSTHTPARWEFGRTWLEGLNAGDPTGDAYLSVVRRLQRPGLSLNDLPAGAREIIERAYATVEITDSVAQLGGHQVALARGYANRLQAAIDALESDVTALSPDYHQTTAVLDKIAGGQLIARRQDMAANQLLSHIVEQLLARGKRVRDTEVAVMNMRLLGLRDGRRAQASLLRGAANDLDTWRQP